MCGLAGILPLAPGGDVVEGDLLTLRDAQRHRGPDGAGIWIAPGGRIGLAHRRLSIVDLSPLGHQPMATPDGRLHVVFNGEIYNWKALRSELEGRGHTFRSRCDTEVLLHGYREWGRGLLPRLRGMYAFAIWDHGEGRLLLARDPLGIKPLYWSAEGGRLAFASEIRPLRAIARSGELDPQAVAAFLTWGSIPAPRTLWAGIRSLPPGSILEAEQGGLTPLFGCEEVWGPTGAQVAGEEGRTLAREALADSVRHHLLADVPVGVFLSGGVDSSALLGLVAETHTGPVRAVTICFDIEGLDERRYARLAAATYGAEASEILLRARDLRERIPDAIKALDQPSIDGINSFFVAEAAAQAGLKAVISGVGGDELFGGYPTFARLPRIRRVHRMLSALPGLAPACSLLEAVPQGRRTAKLARALAYGGDSHGAYFADRGLFSPREIRRLLAPELAGAIDAAEPRADLRSRVPLDALPPEEHVTALELGQFLKVQLLRDIDAVSMRHSIEVRTPLVDVALLRALRRIEPGTRTAGPAKLCLREAPRPPLPEPLWNRKKQGFTLPFERWLRSGQLEARLPRHPWLRREGTEAVERAWRKGRLHWSRLWALHVLGEYLR